MASSFGAAGSLAVLLMCVLFRTAVLLLGAEFSAAQPLKNGNPRGSWGIQPDAPPGNRAKLASVLAASTVPEQRGVARRFVRSGDARASRIGAVSAEFNRRGSRRKSIGRREGARRRTLSAR